MKPNLKLLPFQQDGVDQITSQKNTLLADEMGLGKTVQAICAINKWRVFRKILIICPASVKLKWEDELWRWLDMYYEITSVFGRSTLTAEILEHTEILILNYDIVVDYIDILKKVRWDLKIVDECQYLNGRFARRTSAVLSIWSAYNLFLSGSPAELPIELWPILRHLSPNDWPKVLWDYALRYCDPQRKENAHTGGEEWDLRGAANLNEIHETLKRTIMIRRRKEDVLDQLKPKERTYVYADVDDGYLAAERAAVEMSGHEYEELVEGLYAGDIDFGDCIATTRKAIGLAKIPAAVEYICDLLEKHEKILCYVYHIAVIKELEDRLKERIGDACLVVKGSVSLKNRERALKEFKENHVRRVYLGQIKAMGTGTDGLQDITNIGLFVELDWSFKSMVQAEDRIHRFGQENAAKFTYLVVRDSLEEYMVKKLMSKKRNYNEMFDGPIKNIEEER